VRSQHDDYFVERALANPLEDRLEQDALLGRAEPLGRAGGEDNRGYVKSSR